MAALGINAVDVDQIERLLPLMTADERAELDALIGAPRRKGDYSRYREDPVAYIQEVLGVTLWQVQIDICRALLKYKRVFVKAGHSVGKSHLAGGLVNWMFDCFNPGITITSAPTKESVNDIVWKEVRSQRPRSMHGDLMPKSARMETAEDHFAVGYTASGEAAFHGRHEEAIFLLYDECVGIDLPFWAAGEGMMSSQTAYWLAFCNPTDTGSAAYDICINDKNWHVIEISCLDHPNVLAASRGEPLPFPKAVAPDWVDTNVRRWCEPVAQGDGSPSKGHIEWPLGCGNWWKPGPLAESRLLGRWPSAGTNAVWSDATWQAALVAQSIVTTSPLRIGCDKAWHGDDYTSIVARRGNCAVWHETHNGWGNDQIAGRLKQLCHELALPGEDPKKIICPIDDVQGGVTDFADGYAFVDVNSSHKAIDAERFPNVRSELWFSLAERAQEGRVDLSRLSEESQSLLRRQLMAPTWRVDNQGRQVVEEKDKTKQRLGRSPDDADAANLAFREDVDWKGAILSDAEMAQYTSPARLAARDW